MLLLTALSALGITEFGADNHGKMVELFQSTIGKPIGQSWCLDFLQSCVAYVETFGFTSALFPTESCLIAWANSTCVHPVDPLPGDIVVYRHGDTTKGHVGIITSILPKSFFTVEGNTGALNGEINRNGDGVYARVRPRGGIGQMQELGFLRPFSG